MRQLYIILFLSFGSLMAQQMPQFRQVNTSPSLYTPAGMAMNKQTSISLLARWQMLGFGNEPRTIAFFGQAMIKKRLKLYLIPEVGFNIQSSPWKRKKSGFFNSLLVDR